MKKMLFACGVMGLVCAAFADLDTLITFSTKGPDKYADGTTVVDGECYALVYASADGFQGLNADGSCVDANDRLLLTAPLAKAGCCPPVLYVVKADVAATLSGGSYGVYLLDTRTAEGTAAGVTAEGKPARVNSYGAVASNVSAGAGALTSTADAVAAVEKAGGVAAGTASAVPADAPAPKITAIRLLGDNVQLTVSSTVPYLSYGVAAGSDPANLTAGKEAAPANGNATKDITLIVPKQGDAAFFKVNRK